MKKIKLFIVPLMLICLVLLFRAKADQNQIVHNPLIGIWRLAGDINSTFWISNDSICYTDYSNACYYYRINSDTIVIYYNDWVNKTKYNIIGDDTLLFVNDDKIDTLLRFYDN